MAATATAYTPVTNAGDNAPACGYQCAPRGGCTATWWTYGDATLADTYGSFRYFGFTDVRHVVASGLRLPYLRSCLGVGTASKARWASHAVR